MHGWDVGHAHVAEPGVSCRGSLLACPMCLTQLLTGSPPTSHSQGSSDLCWSSVEFVPPERSQQEANATCPEKLIPELKTTVAFKDHRENKRFQQIFFLRRPRSLVGFPSCKHSKSDEGRGRNSAGQNGTPFRPDRQDGIVPRISVLL